jgi:hypothetical protein
MDDGCELSVAGIRIIGGFQGGTKLEKGGQRKAAKDRVQGTSINTTDWKRAKTRNAVSVPHE